MPNIVLRMQTGETVRFPLNKDRVNIGRNSDNEIVLDSALVSRHHAYIEKKGNQYSIFELSSKNGTYVNGILIKECLLQDQDVITVGNCKLVFDEFDNKSVTVSPESSLAILNEVSKAINHINNENDLLKHVLSLVMKIVNAERGMVLLVNEKIGNLETKLVLGMDGKKNRVVISKTILENVLKQKKGLIVSDIDVDDRFSKQESIIDSGIKSIISVPMLLKNRVIGIMQVDTSKKGKKFVSEDLDLLCSFSDFLSIGIEQIRLNDEIQRETKLITNLERFHSPEVVNMIISSVDDKKDINLNVEEKYATILFADICNFTNLSEKLDPVEIAEILNDFFNIMTNVIFEYNGTLDKYIGDSVMALFGVPYSPEKHADRAVYTAIKMQKEIKRFMRGVFLQNHFEIKIGINTGKVVAGNIGSLKRMEYTVLGDTVNLASRLCSKCKPSSILIGSSTKDILKNSFSLKDKEVMSIKGKEKDVDVYEIDLGKEY